MSTEESRITINITRFRIGDLPSRPCNILIVGPSESRKNACVQRLMDVNRRKNTRTAIVTSFPEFYEESTFNPRKGLPFDELDNAHFRVFEGLPVLSADHFGYFESHPDCSTVITNGDYPKQIPRLNASAIDYIILFGGVKQLRRAWDDFGALVPKFRDFRQIYLACTSEGDRYSDDFMVIKNDPNTNDPNDILYWGSLTRANVQDISASIETSLVLNKVKTAQHVEIPEPSPIKVEIKETLSKQIQENEETLSKDLVEQIQENEEHIENDDEHDEREARDDCCIM